MENSMKKTFRFKSDAYKKARGGYSRCLLLRCEKCKQTILLYQKDGPGILKRLYVDRVIAPAGLPGRKNQNLTCKGCKTVLGIPFLYKKENRPAWRLFAGAVEKEVVGVGEVAGIRF